MKFNLLGAKEITDFEKEIGIELVVTELSSNALSLNNGYQKYCVQFEFCTCVIGHNIYDVVGRGNTMDEAIIDYCDTISGNTLIDDYPYANRYNGYVERKESFRVPKLKHTKLLGK